MPQQVYVPTNTEGYVVDGEEGMHPLIARYKGNVAAQTGGVPFGGR
jgi:hypothetical protein